MSFLQWRKSNYLLRLIVFTWLIGTFPVVFLGAFSYLKSTQVIQEKVDEGSLQVLQQTQSRIDQELKTVDHLILQYVDTPFVKSLLSKTLTAEEHEQENELQTGLNQLKTFEFGIHNIYVANLQQDWLVHNNGLYELSRHEMLGTINNWARLSASSSWVYQNIGPNVFVTLVKKLPVNSMKPIGLIAVQIPSYDINKMLSTNRKLGSLMIIDKNGIIIAHDDPSLLGKTVENESFFRQILKSGEERGRLEVKQGERSDSVIYRRSDYNGWLYVSIASNKEITKDSRAIGWLTLAMCFVIFSVTMVLSFLGSRRMYSPIRKLVDIVRTASRGHGSKQEHDELKFIEDNVHILAKVQSDLEGEMQNHLRQLEVLYVLKLLHGELKESEITEKMRLFYSGFPWTNFGVLTVQIDALEGTRYKELDRDLLLYAVNNIVYDLIPQEERLIPILIGQCQATVICCIQTDKGHFKKRMYQWAEAVQRTVAQVLDLHVSIGISRSYGCMKDMEKAYAECLDALKYRLWLGDEIIIHAEDRKSGAAGKPIFPAQTSGQLYDAVKLGDREKASSLLSSFMQQLHEADCNPQEYQMCLLRLLLDVIKILDDNGEYLDSGYSDSSLAEQLLQLHTAKEIERWFNERVISPVAKRMDEKREFQYKKIADEILELIHRNYDTDLSLEICASMLNYHPSYIKKVFRKGTGVNFSDYLTQYRMSMAKAWLADTGIKISDIAEKLRYNNSQNFIRQFRKSEGVTPGQYRKTYGTADFTNEN